MDEADFEEELHQLISTAIEEDLEFERAYPVRSSPEGKKNYEVMITEISDTAD